MNLSGEYRDEPGFFGCKEFQRRFRACLARLAILGFVWIVAVSCVSAQNPARKNILIITEVSETHPSVAVVTRQIREELGRNPNYAFEFFVESLDTTDFSSMAAQSQIRESTLRKYREINIDLVVAVGPAPVQFISTSPESFLPNIPIVICGAILSIGGPPKLDSRFTGTWMSLEPDATLDAALRLFPNTKHVALVAGTSAFDLERLAVVRAGLPAYQSRLDLIDLTNLEMPVLLQRLRRLPSNTVVLYVAFFKDAAGKLYVDATTALPLVVQAANAPVFGMSDTYLGRGIIGGKVINYTNQGTIAAGLLAQLLAGKKTEELPITIARNSYIFDAQQLRRWHIDESLLPAESRVLFRKTPFWENDFRHITVALLVTGLMVSFIYIVFKQEQLRRARHKHSELSGLLIDAQEIERGRLARELHDDFSQRVALMSLGLEMIAETIPRSPQEANRQVHLMMDSTIELGEDLHTLSHRLHSSTLESLGLATGVTALCKEFQAQQKVQVDFRCSNIPRDLDSNAALCIFRIVQEALRNVKKHSGTDRAEVNLEIAGRKIHLSVCDHGAGFDTSFVRRQALGLKSMEERLRSLGGTLQVHSRPGEGTRIEAWIPLEPNGSRHQGNSVA
jgi:signal transduction histidine kinase